MFLPLTKPEDPKEKRLLIFDGHASHETKELMWECYKNNVHLIYLPPYTSHVLQPLDISCFGPLKNAYRWYIGYLNYYSDSSPIGKQRFLECYRKARIDALTVLNIKAGWAATGLWPVWLSKPLANPLLLQNSNKLSDQLLGRVATGWMHFLGTACAWLWPGLAAACLRHSGWLRAVAGHLVPTGAARGRA